jgi:hypothetical protein
MDKKLFAQLIGSVKEAGKVKRGRTKASRTSEIKATRVTRSAGVAPAAKK